MNRRIFLQSSLASGALATGVIRKPGFAQTPAAANYVTPAVETEYGRVRGVVRDGVQTFRGLPYGASPAGRNRFMPPRRPEKWNGVRDAFRNPLRAVQTNPTPMAHANAWRSFEPMGEDCLGLNVFTPGTSGKRPVMFYCHGGGYVYGQAIGIGNDGVNLARSGDVVVVNVHHRLNVFGFLDLSEYGSAYASSGNVSMLDLVAALEWVRNNIAHFGGDPGNVTIFGQSGGGGKVSTLMAMPSAKGLFHKAIVESGSTLTQIHKDESQKTTQKILSNLGLRPNQIAELHTMPAEKLLAAINGAGALGPVVDGKVLPRDPFEPTAPDISADIPMLIGTAETEGTYFVSDELLTLDEKGMRTRLARSLGDDTDRIVALFRKTRPKATPSQLYFTILGFPTRAMTQAQRKTALGKAPAYLYYWTWHTPIENGRRFSPHMIELPFVFNNPWLDAELVGTEPEIQTLADRVSGSWVAFARTGSPDNSRIPKWPAYDGNTRATMIINNDWKVVNDLNREERLAMAKFARLPMM